MQYSGKLSSGATLTLTFNNYNTSSKTFSGQMTATISNSNTIALVINNATVTDDKGAATVNGNLTMTVNLNNTPQNTPDTTLDFFPENGACDDVALMTIGGVSKKINLGS